MKSHYNENFLSDYKYGLDAIEDLHKLGSPDLIPIISRLHYHLSEIRRKAEDTLKNHPGLDSIKTKIRKDFDLAIEEAFFSIDKCTQLNIKKTTSNLNLIEWGKLSECLPLAIEMINTFPIQGALDVEYNAKSLKLGITLSRLENLDKLKTKVYRLSRDFFNIKILPTFELEEDNKIVFKFDYSFSEDKGYVVELKKKRVVLSNTLEAYEVPIEKLDSISKEPVLIMNSHGELCFFENLDNQKIKNTIKGFSEPALFHLPFLFRPLSIIIPERGEVAPFSGFFSTGCENLLTDQNFGPLSKPVQAIDIFSILSN